MIVKFLGALDIIFGISFFISIFTEIFNSNLLLVFGIILIIKGFAFISKLDLNSILDITIGFIFILSVYVQIPFYLKLILSGYLIQKGIFSFI